MKQILMTAIFLSGSVSIANDYPEKSFDLAEIRLENFLAARKENEKMSCKKIAENMSEVMTEAIFESISPRIQAYGEEKLVTAMKTERVGTYCPKKYRELDGCFAIVKDVPKQVMETVYTGRYLEYSEQCAKQVPYKGWGRYKKDDDSHSDSKDPKIKARLMANIKEVLENKFSLNISDKKMKLCRYDLDQAVKKNLTQQCYSYLVDKKYDASIFENQLDLARLEGEVRYQRDLLERRGLIKGANPQGQTKQSGGMSK